MVNQIEILIRQVYEKQVQTEQARRKQLQAQINPHFLYNSFYMGYRWLKVERVIVLRIYACI
ncbi:MAG: sensor histidine kinase [Lachnospiraceae bacterium]